MLIKINISYYLGRYSPVRRASEGSRNPQQGPFQECQQLQKGLAAQQRNNYLVTPTTKPENSVSLPGMLILQISNNNNMKEIQMEEN